MWILYQTLRGSELNWIMKKMDKWHLSSIILFEVWLVYESLALWKEYVMKNQNILITRILCQTLGESELNYEENG